MKRNRNNKNGSAIALALVFATVLLLMGLAYSKMTAGARVQTVKIDERIKLDFLAHGMTELALLKFQLFPADFYACMEAASYSPPINNNDTNNKLISFRANDDTFRFDRTDTSSIQTIFKLASESITLHLASMTILTNNKWGNEVLYIEAGATYTDVNGEETSKIVTRLVNLDRKSLIPTTN